jgi:hypothetical protein
MCKGKAEIAVSRVCLAALEKIIQRNVVQALVVHLSCFLANSLGKIKG